MRHWTKSEFHEHSEFFGSIGKTARMQVALMTLAREQASGEFGTDHPHADQLLFVVSGQGKAIVGEYTLALEPGDLVLVEAGEKHQFLGDSDEPFRTLNIYAPVAYPDE